jgi:hypothetical protein
MPCPDPTVRSDEAHASSQDGPASTPDGWDARSFLNAESLNGSANA